MEINGRKVEIHVKGGFSERKGIKHFSDIVQVDSLTERTRNKLYTATEDAFNGLVGEYKNFFVEYVYEELFSLTKRDIPDDSYSWKYNYSKVFKNIYSIFKLESYEDIFTFIEGIIRVLALIASYNKNNYIKDISSIFVAENVNYRIVNDQIMDIVDEEQIQSIEETLKSPYDVVKKHYAKAIEKLYKENDYSNSIKESITTVESMCQILTKNDKATLGDSLKVLKSDIHPAMRGAFEKLYGYTSDAKGIRHANGVGEENATFSEAKFMLIICSAFVNYLKENFEEK